MQTDGVIASAKELGRVGKGKQVVRKMSGGELVKNEMIFFFQQKTAYEVVISDWGSGVCSSVLPPTCFSNTSMLKKKKKKQKRKTKNRKKKKKKPKNGRASWRERMSEILETT